MALIIELDAELEHKIREEAAKTGLDTQTYIVRTLKEQLLHPESDNISLSTEETVLLQQINLGLSQRDWQRYHTLVNKRRKETLCPEEQADLIALSDRIEAANARRMHAVAQLALLRHTSIEAMMQDLGLPEPTYV